MTRGIGMAAVLSLLSGGPAQAGEELLRNGALAHTANDGPVEWGISDSAGVRWLAGENPPCLRLDATGKGSAPGVGQIVELPQPRPEALRVRAEVKMTGVRRGEKSWHSGRILVTYLDPQGHPLGETFTLDRLQGDSDWKAVSRQFPVLPGAARVRLELQLLNAARGSIFFRNVSLSALNAEEAGAWRKEAEERIREHRMAPLSLRVEDGAGRALSGAEVAVFLRRHAYPFGTAVKTRLLLADPGDPHGDTYRAVVENFFNYATLENELKAPHVEKKGMEEPLRALAWLKERGIARRGHVLTWPSYEMSARAVSAAKDEPDKVRTLMKAHFRDLLAATAPLAIVDWDVVNEPAVHTDLIRLLGEPQVREWFRWAREGAPQARLFLNENNVEFRGGNRDNLEGWLQLLQRQGASIDGIGWQGHMWHRTLPSGQNILDDLDHFARYGLPIQITEYDTDARFSDEEDARFLEEFLTAWFSHPLTAGFILWGFQDALIWNGNAPLFREDWSLKPSGKVWMDLVFGKWWTEETGRTDAVGIFETRGFLGAYEVEVRHGGRRVIRQVTLPKEGLNTVICLDTSAEPDEPATRLVSRNPYRAGKLPARIEPRNREVATVSRTVTLREGHGTWGLSPTAEGSGLVLQGEENAQNRRDLFLRFDTRDLPPNSVAAAEVVLQAAGSLPGPVRLRYYVLSPRFVAQGWEAGLDWKPEDLTVGRAPGRDAETGEYRLGDASVIFLGEELLKDVKPGAPIRLASPELARAAQNAGAKGLTVILSIDNQRLVLAGPDDEAGQPALHLKLKK